MAAPDEHGHTVQEAEDLHESYIEFLSFFNCSVTVLLTISITSIYFYRTSKYDEGKFLSSPLRMLFFICVIINVPLSTGWMYWSDIFLPTSLILLPSYCQVAQVVATVPFFLIKNCAYVESLFSMPLCPLPPPSSSVSVLPKQETMLLDFP